MPDAQNRIILIEDSPSDVLLVSEALRRVGISFDLNVLDDGEKAIEFIDRVEQDAQAECPHLVLLDLNLPKRSGNEVLEHMGHSKRWRGVPIIIFSSSDLPKDREQTLRLGAKLYFHKPSNLKEFMKLGPVVRGILNGDNAGS